MVLPMYKPYLDHTLKYHHWPPQPVSAKKEFPGILILLKKIKKNVKKIIKNANFEKENVVLRLQILIISLPHIYFVQKNPFGQLI